MSEERRQYGPKWTPLSEIIEEFERDPKMRKRLAKAQVRFKDQMMYASVLPAPK